MSAYERQQIVHVGDCVAEVAVWAMDDEEGDVEEGCGFDFLLEAANGTGLFRDDSGDLPVTENGGVQIF